VSAAGNGHDPDAIYRLIALEFEAERVAVVEAGEPGLPF
jgi:hypothetical protein